MVREEAFGGSDRLCFVASFSPAAMTSTLITRTGTRYGTQHSQGSIAAPPTTNKKRGWACSDHRRPQALLSAKALLNSITPSAPRSDSTLHPMHLRNGFYIEIKDETSNTNSFWIDFIPTACVNWSGLNNMDVTYVFAFQINNMWF